MAGCFETKESGVDVRQDLTVELDIEAVFGIPVAQDRERMHIGIPHRTVVIISHFAPHGIFRRIILCGKGRREAPNEYDYCRQVTEKAGKGICSHILFCC